MLASYKRSLRAAFVVVLYLGLGLHAYAQSNSASINGTVVDSSGAVVPNATVEIHNPVSHFDRSTTTDGSGVFNFPNVPFNPYHLSVTSKGFAPYAQDVEIRSAVPLEVKVALKVGTSESVTVEAEGADLLENASPFHTDVDRNLFDKLPLESQSSSVSSLVTMATPGVSADSNGLFHGLGDHAENSFSVDGQPITDQQSKVFSNQLPIDSVQSLEVISGAPPAEFGDKTSLVIKATTRSGQGVTTPHGSVIASYGAFGTANAGFDLAYGGQNWGNFIAVNGLNSGRFLDGPEFTVMHDKGNEENVFDRVDYQFNTANSLHLDLLYTRSWFQTPNSFDGQFASPWFGVVVANGGLGPDGKPVGPTDQRSKIGTYNIAPTWTRLINSSTVLTLGGFVRRDQFNYYGSDNPFADLGPSNLQQEAASQFPTLTNAGAHSELSIVKGNHNIKAGVVYEQTFLTEHDTFGIVDPTLNAVCLNADGTPDTNPAITAQTQCTGALQPNLGQGSVGAFVPILGCIDLTRTAPLPASDGCPAGRTNSAQFLFPGHTDVKQLAMYVQDSITVKNWSFNLGIRGDIYEGLSHATQAEPRLGVAYNIKQTNTVLRVSYARTLETPFNENLVLSSLGCNNDVLSVLLLCTPGANSILSPGF